MKPILGEILRNLKRHCADVPWREPEKVAGEGGDTRGFRWESTNPDARKLSLTLTAEGNLRVHREGPGLPIGAERSYELPPVALAEIRDLYRWAAVNADG